MIDIGPYRYLPSVCFGLTPFGSEIFWNNYLVHSRKAVNIYIRYGIPTFHHSWGIGLYNLGIVDSDNLTFNLGFDLWNQPSMEMMDSEGGESKGGFGGAISCKAKLKLMEKYPQIYLVGEARSKTIGYLPGEPLGDALVLRGGLSFNL